MEDDLPSPEEKLITDGHKKSRPRTQRLAAGWSIPHRYRGDGY
jgi:hypothetical protein